MLNDYAAARTRIGVEDRDGHWGTTRVHARGNQAAVKFDKARGDVHRLLVAKPNVRIDEVRYA